MNKGNVKGIPRKCGLLWIFAESKIQDILLARWSVNNNFHIFEKAIRWSFLPVNMSQSGIEFVLVVSNAKKRKGEIGVTLRITWILEVSKFQLLTSKAVFSKIFQNFFLRNKFFRGFRKFWQKNNFNNF